MTDLLLPQRRRLLGTAAALPVLAYGASGSRLALAQESTATPNANKHTFMLGDFEVSTLLAGARVFEEPQGTFGMNVDAEEFAAASAANFIPTDKAQAYFTPTVVRAGNDIVLFDTGFGPDSILPPLAAAGISAEDVTVVVITHMHGDHIGGLSSEAGITFPNARYVTGQVEFDTWQGMDNDNFKARVAPLAEKMTFIGDGEDVVSGITSMAAFGHSPGHMTYLLDSGNKQLLIAADFANHYVWSLAYPDWEVRFDMDKTAATASRKKILAMLEAERLPFIGYHMPFPGYGYVAAGGEGQYRYVPASYQMNL
jgi:glyoxylase-like metal-dependent hydrolase (beta-lactamase superfamily II)